MRVKVLGREGGLIRVVNEPLRSPPLAGLPWGRFRVPAAPAASAELVTDPLAGRVDQGLGFRSEETLVEAGMECIHI